MVMHLHGISGLVSCVTDSGSLYAGGIEDAQLSNLELSQIATGMWPALAPVRASLALGVAAEASAHVQQLTTQQLCDCVSGVALCGLVDKEFMGKAATILSRDAGCLSPDQLCDVAAAYARTGTTNHELFVQLTAIAHMHIEQRNLDAAQATVLAWAFTIHGAGSPIIISRLFQSISVRPLLPLYPVQVSLEDIYVAS